MVQIPYGILTLKSNFTDTYFQKEVFTGTDTVLLGFFLGSLCSSVTKPYSHYNHWGKADDRNCNYGHPKMADMKLGKNLFCRLNCFYNVF